MMQLRNCSPSEKVILTAMVALAMELPGELGRYTEALGEIRKAFRRGKTLHRAEVSCVQTHEPRVRERWT